MDNSNQTIKQLFSIYKKTIVALQGYDREIWPKSISKEPSTTKLTYDEVKTTIGKLKQEMLQWGTVSDLFGKEREDILKNILDNIYQSFSGKELYPTLQEKAANLLYLLIKDHPFSDGNKKIAAFIFVYFLSKNNMLYKPNQALRINDKALTFLVLFIAESRPEEKENIIKLIENLLS